MNTARALGVILAVVLLLFLHTTKYRSPFLLPTYLQEQAANQVDTAFTLVNINAWLQGLPFPERLYTTKSIDTDTVSYGLQVGAIVPAYLLIKVLSFLNVNIIEDRGLQLFTLYSLGVFIHLMIVILACLLAFVLFRRCGYNHFNAALVGLVPAFVLIYNPAYTTLLQINYSSHAFVIPLLLGFIILELVKPRRSVRLAQQFIALYGCFTDNLFVLAIIVVWVIRCLRKEKHHILTLLPAIVFLLLHPETLTMQFQSKHFFNYLQHSYLYVRLLYGAMGLAMLCILPVACIVAASLKVINRHLATVIVMLLVLPLLYTILLALQQYPSMLTPELLKFGLPVCFSFILVPALYLAALKIPLDRFTTVIKTYKVQNLPLFILLFAVLYSLALSFGRHSHITKFFTPPDLHTQALGNFVRKNTDYQDILFSSDVKSTPHLYSLAGKHIHPARDTHMIYQLIKDQQQTFTINILLDKNNKPAAYQQGKEFWQSFLQERNIAYQFKHGEHWELLAFSGLEFKDRH